MLEVGSAGRYDLARDQRGDGAVKGTHVRVILAVMAGVILMPALLAFGYLRKRKREEERSSEVASLIRRLQEKGLVLLEETSEVLEPHHLPIGQD